jgi:sugar phosphate isomerase/epimerase
MRIELGCFTRPWGQYTLEEALAGIAAAGYQNVGLTSVADTPLFSDEWSDQMNAQVAALVSEHALRAQVTFGNPDVSLRGPEAAAKFARQLDWCRGLGIDYMVLLGTEDSSRYEAWFEAAAGCLDAAAERGITLVLKPHGGLSSLADDLLRAASRLAHPAFGICYDPGNIYYYTGQKAEDDLPKVAKHVRAMCIKDETGGKHGEVMITPGTGLVDFERIFSILSEAGFSGPCWVECVGGSSLAEIDAEARKAFEFVNALIARTGG